jgi:hypothetical protein
MINIELYHGIPYKYESFLIEKYHSFTTTCHYIETYHNNNDINYILIYDNKKLMHILIFKNLNKISICLNTLIHIDQEVLNIYSKKIFNEFPKIKEIKIVNIYNNNFNSKTITKTSKSNNYTMFLPNSIDNYYLMLGTKTRKHIKNYKRRLIRDFPDVKFISLQGGNIKKEFISKIINLNSERMLSKGISPGINKEYENNIINYSQHYGFICYIEINKQIIAGAISYIINNDIYLHVIAHDNKFNKYNIGQVCLFHLISTSIEKGLTSFHFLWGRNEYKTRFLAQPQPMYSYSIFKSYSFYYYFRIFRIFLNIHFTNVRNSELLFPLKKIIISFKKNYKIS